jgi:hypothetical protein
MRRREGYRTTLSYFSSSLSTVQPHILLLDYLLLFGSKSCVFEDLRLFLDSFPDESVDEALQTFEQMVADDPVNFDCEDIDIRENVSTFHVCTRYNYVDVFWMGVWGKVGKYNKVPVIFMEVLCLLHMYMYMYMYIHMFTN